MKRTRRLAPVLLAVSAVSGCAGTTVVHTHSAKSELESISPAASAHRPAPAAPPSEPARPVPTAKPVTSDAPCPYLDTAFVMDTVGQHITRSTVTTTTPASCAFYRPDGAVAAQVDRRTYPSATAAAAAAKVATGSGANPVSDLGNGGGVAIVGSGAVLGVSAGPVVVVVRVNQQSSLECHELAARSLPG